MHSEREKRERERETLRRSRKQDGTQLCEGVRKKKGSRQKNEREKQRRNTCEKKRKYSFYGLFYCYSLEGVGFVDNKQRVVPGLFMGLALVQQNGHMGRHLVQQLIDQLQLLLLLRCIAIFAIATHHQRVDACRNVAQRDMHCGICQTLRIHIDAGQAEALLATREATEEAQQQQPAKLHLD